MSYPIRFSRSAWSIPIYVRYRNCDYIRAICGIAPKDGDIVNSPIRVLDIEEEPGLYTLDKLDEPVIPPCVFRVVFDFPLTRPFVDVVQHSHAYVTRGELLAYISRKYKAVYAQELLTSSPIEYTIHSECLDCLGCAPETMPLDEFDPLARNPSGCVLDSLQHRPAIDVLDPLRNGSETHSRNPKGCVLDCSICKDDSNTSEACKLTCGHMYHKSCILTWFETGKDTCPVCRASAVGCSTCKGSRAVAMTRSAIVIPFEDRDGSMNRNTTNGVYGIHTKDLETLIIQGMVFDKSTNTLKLEIV